MRNIKHWLIALRLRTLPLALSSILMGNFLALEQGKLSLLILLLSLFATICLQILSNLANDYGDSVHGADHTGRKGPARAVQSGWISPAQMKKAIYLFVLLSLASGIALLYVAFLQQHTVPAFPKLWIEITMFFAVGLGAIYAAIAYTVGKKPYGYRGLGDLVVLLFFGFIGVTGAYFIQTRHFSPHILLPALSCGLLAVGVININNIRDMASDKKAGKYSIPIRIGRKHAVKYHIALLSTAILSALAFQIIHAERWQAFLFLLTLPLFIKNANAVRKVKHPAELDPYLRQLALSTLLFVLLFGIGGWL